jgi:membrane protease YdiL (CAAX protease family)
MKRYPLLSFFLLTFLISWGILLPEVAAARGWLTNHMPQVLLVVAGYGPALAAVLVSLAGQGWQGLGTLLQRLLIVRVGIQWYLIALLLPVAILLAALGIHLALGGSVAWGVTTTLDSLIPAGISPWLLVLPVFLLQGLILMGEELGWRAFALPRLQSMDNALISSLILGVIWGVWHLPMAFAPRTGALISQVPLLLFGIDILASTFVYTWVFNNTRGSVLLVLLLHASTNTAAMFLPIFSTLQEDMRLFFIVVALRWGIALVIVIAGGEYFARRFSKEEITA